MNPTLQQILESITHMVNASPPPNSGVVVVMYSFIREGSVSDYAVVGDKKLAKKAMESVLQDLSK